MVEVQEETILWKKSGGRYTLIAAYWSVNYLSIIICLKIDTRRSIVCYRLEAYHCHNYHYTRWFLFYVQQLNTLRLELNIHQNIQALNCMIASESQIPWDTWYIGFWWYSQTNCQISLLRYHRKIYIEAVDGNWFFLIYLSINFQIEDWTWCRGYPSHQIFTKRTLQAL